MIHGEKGEGYPYGISPEAAGRLQTLRDALMQLPNTVDPLESPARTPETTTTHPIASETTGNAADSAFTTEEMVQRLHGGVSHAFGVQA